MATSKTKTARQKPHKKKPATAKKQKTAKKPETWKLRLYVAGQTAKSTRALANLQTLCNQHLMGRYQIEVIDLLEHPDMARGDQIVAVPALVVKLPQQVRQIIGDLSDTDKVLVGLALQEVV
jgi:circadian clock protein KaiB